MIVQTETLSQMNNMYIKLKYEIIVEIKIMKLCI
jgi:hypothetical protein